jgi:hypothetical protein
MTKDTIGTKSIRCWFSRQPGRTKLIYCAAIPKSQLRQPLNRLLGILLPFGDHLFNANKYAR